MLASPAVRTGRRASPAPCQPVHSSLTSFVIYHAVCAQSHHGHGWVILRGTGEDRTRHAQRHLIYSQAGPPGPSVPCPVWHLGGSTPVDGLTSSWLSSTCWPAMPYEESRGIEPPGCHPWHGFQDRLHTMCATFQCRVRHPGVRLLVLRGLGRPGGQDEIVHV